METTMFGLIVYVVGITVGYWAAVVLDRRSNNLKVSDLSRLEIRPGETVVITCDQVLTVKQINFIRDAFSSAIPPGIKVVVLDQGLKIGVIGKQSGERT